MNMFALPKTVTVLVVAVLIAGPAAAQAPLPFDYNFEEEARLADRLDVDNPDPDTLRDVFERRRARVLSAIPAGAMLIYSVERAQERRLEFQVPHSDNHDFIYLTGLDGIDSLDSALLLLPAANDARGRLDEPVRDWVVLYTSGNPEKISARTGIEDVRPFDVLENDLSVAMTDFRDWRITQVRRWPLAAALSRAWGEDDKVLYLNYPRFFRLGMPEPTRLEAFQRIQRFSPEIRARDSADILDRVRMLQDSWSIANLRRAVDITRDGITVALGSARAGMTETQVMQTMDFVYRYHGATLGFPTSVRREGVETAADEPAIPEGWIEFVPRSGGARFTEGDMVWTDTGAAFNHYSADVQRNVPVSGRLTDEQRRLYEIALDVQKTVICRRLRRALLLRHRSLHRHGSARRGRLSGAADAGHGAVDRTGGHAAGRAPHCVRGRRAGYRGRARMADRIDSDRDRRRRGIVLRVGRPRRVYRKSTVITAARDPSPAPASARYPHRQVPARRRTARSPR
jgi:Xaa-Pro aminopeptidase